MSNTKWIKRWDYMIAPEPALPGVWRRKEGGCVVRGRTTDPRSGKLKEVLRALPSATPKEAFQWLQLELEKTRQDRGSQMAATTKPRFAEFARDLLDRKVALHEIKSEKNHIQWEYVLERRLIPAFGKFFIDKVTRDEIEAWQKAVYRQIEKKELSPNSANNWLSILRVIMNNARDQYRWTFDPLIGVRPFDTSEHESYPAEEPNSLTASETREFLLRVRAMFPQHFGMTALGFGTGLRPSALRPLRRQGESCDVRWNDGELLVRRSHTVGNVVMNTTKTGLRQQIALPPALVEILRWHVANLPEGPMTESDLLFPSETGGFRSPTVLQKPFDAVAKAMQLKKHISPRAMRRTFQDLARAANVRDLVTRAISGHATEAMQQRYSTVNANEMRDGLAAVISLAGFREAHDAGSVGQVVGKVVGNGSAP